ncbi:hypothetical protein [Nostoc sp.]|uniref:hypothetical protein n=1 Tax=Nostoc sp. TaxID=1180 RepID=UPI002FFA71D1
MSTLPDSLNFQTGTQLWQSWQEKISTFTYPYFNTMLRHKLHQYPTTTNNQLNQLFRQLSQISRNSSENTGLIIAYLSLLGFLSAGFFGIFALLISQRFYSNPPQVNERLPITGTVTQPIK